MLGGSRFPRAGSHPHPGSRLQPRRKRNQNWERRPVKPARAGARSPPAPPAAPRPPLPPGWVSSRQPRLPRTCLHTFVYRRTYKKAGKANTASPSSSCRHRWSRQPGRTGAMLRVGGGAGGCAPMGASWGVVQGQGISLLSPVGSRPGMGEASDSDSGIMLHSGERRGGILPGWGRGSLGVLPSPTRALIAVLPPPPYTPGLRTGALQCMGPPWGHTKAPCGGGIGETGGSPGFGGGTQAWRGGPGPALTQPGFARGWLSQGETFPVCPPPRWEITAAPGEPEHPWVLRGGVWGGGGSRLLFLPLGLGEN